MPVFTGVRSSVFSVLKKRAAAHRAILRVWDFPTGRRREEKLTSLHCLPGSEEKTNYRWKGDQWIDTSLQCKTDHSVMKGGLFFFYRAPA